MFFRLSRRALKSTLLLCALWFLLSCGRQATPEENGPPVSIKEDPTHTLVLENDLTRVFRVELPAGAATKLHKHDVDYVSVVLSDAEMEGFSPGKSREAIHRNKGQVRYTNGGLVHGNLNTGKTTFRCLVIELLRKPGEAGEGPQKEGEHSLDLGHGHIQDVVLNRPRVQVTDLQLSPGAQSDEDAAGNPRLLVWMADGELMAGERTLQGKEGDVVWLGMDRAALHNPGHNPAHVMVAQFR